MMKAKLLYVCVEYIYYSSSHDSAYLSKKKVVIINGSVNLFAAVQVQFDPQNYNVTEGNVVSITLVTNTSDYMFNFTVTLQYMNGTATGESFKLEIHRNSSHSVHNEVHTIVISLCITVLPSNWQLAVTMKLVHTL